MNEHQFDDLKQFIDSRISQSEKRNDEKLDELRDEFGQLRGEFGQLRQEMLDGFAGVGEAIDGIHELIVERDKEVDQRLTKLEQQIA